MANAYDTDKYYEYRKEYCEGFDFVLTRTEIFSLGSVHFIIDHYEANNDNSQRMKAIMKITNRNGKEKVIECIDEGVKPLVIKIQNNEYIFIRRDLYGYSLINVNTFEEINYFPSRVLEHKEAFIICDVKTLNDLLVLDGCFWGGPYELYVMDFDSRKNVRLSNYCNLIDLKDDSLKIDETKLSFECYESTDNYQFTYIKLKELINEDGILDL